MCLPFGKPMCLPFGKPMSVENDAKNNCWPLVGQFVVGDATARLEGAILNY
jgi:hypothetical protein